VSVYLSFDFGLKRIGVAVGDPVTRTARPLPPIAGGDWSAVDRLLKEWQPAACVVGLPLGKENEEQAITARARAFAAELGRRLQRPVHLCDERYTSLIAMQDLRAARAGGALKRRVRQGDEDSAAARLILEQWLAENQQSGKRE